MFSILKDKSLNVLIKNNSSSYLGNVVIGQVTVGAACIVRLPMFIKRITRANRTVLCSLINEC